MTALQATDRTVAELSLRSVEVRGLGRRLAIPAALAAAVAFVLLAGGHAHAFVDGIERGLRVTPAWAGLGVLFECLSLAGYVALLALVAGRATRRIGNRESAQIAFAGAAATRLLPTAGAGGLGLTVWALRRAGLSARSATKTLLTFLVVLYGAFLGALALAGGALALNLVHGHGPEQLSALPAGAAVCAIVLSIALALRHRGAPVAGASAAPGRRVGDAAQLLGEAVRDACGLVRSGDARVAGAAAYWAFDAAVLWAMLHALGRPPALPVIVLAYFVGQLANTIPVPGSVSGGMAGVLIAFAVPAELALPAVLAYRAVSVWLPAPVALASLPALRATVGRWSCAVAPAGPR
jgi:putative heme transporter